MLSVTEYQTSKRSAKHFIENHIKIDGQPIKLTKTQHKFLDFLEKDEKYNIFVKSREVYFSSIVAMYCVWLLTLYEDINILLISPSEGMRVELFKKVKQYMKYSSDCELKILNSDTLQTVQNSRIISCSEEKMAEYARGTSFNYIFVDEAALLEGELDISYNPISKIILGSSLKLNMLDSYFYKTWKNDAFAKERLHYSDNEDWDRLEIVRMKERFTQLRFLSEMECCFIEQT